MSNKKYKTLGELAGLIFGFAWVITINLLGLWVLYLVGKWIFD